MPVTTTAGVTTIAGIKAGTVLTAAAIATTATAATLSAQQARQQGKTASAIAEYNAQIARNQAKERAEALKVAGAEKQRQILEERRRILARNRAKYGKAGVTMQGSPLLVQQEVARNITQDAVMENYNTQIGVRAAVTRGESEAQISLLRGKAARTAGKLAAGQALFSGAAQIANIGLAAKRLKGADNGQEGKPGRKTGKGA